MVQIDSISGEAQNMYCNEYDKMVTTRAKGTMLTLLTKRQFI